MGGRARVGGWAGRGGVVWEGGGIVEGQGSYGCVAVETWEGEEDRRREGGGAACGYSGIVGRGWLGGNFCFSACEGTATFSTIPFVASAYLSFLGAPAGGMGTGSVAKMFHRLFINYK